MSQDSYESHSTQIIKGQHYEKKTYGLVVCFLRVSFVDDNTLQWCQRAGKVALSVKCLLYNHETLSLIPRTNIKKLGSCTGKEEKTVGSLGLVGQQSSQTTDH